MKRVSSACLLPLLFLILFLCIDTTFAQDILSNKISIENNNTPLTTLLEEISKKAGVRFSYNPNKINGDQVIRYEATQKTLITILDEVGAIVGFTFKIIEGQIVLLPEKPNEKPASVEATLSGFVHDRKSGEAMIGAVLFVDELKTGVVTNAFGFYSVTLPKGDYHIRGSFVGYKEFVKEAPLLSSRQEDIQMDEDPPLLAPVIVTDAKPSAIEEIQAAKIDIRPKAVEERPALFGEMDVIKSLESVPGIKMHSDGSTFYYVRGGFRDQNLVMLDDAPVFNPSHLLGFFSTIIPDAINDITVYKGNMPASLGGRLSSVMYVQTKKGNDQRTQVWGNLGVISTKLGIEGPIKKGASSFMIAARLSRLKWFFQLLDPAVKKFQFYDINGKVNFKLNAANRVFLSFYTGSDDYYINNGAISWANQAATIRWNHIINEKLFVNTTFSGSKYDYFLYPDVANDTRWNSQIANINLKTDFSYFVAPQNVITFGAALSGYFFNPGNLKTKDPNAVFPQLSVRNSSEFVMYGNQEIQLNRRWGLNYGLRITSWTNTGEAFEFVLDNNGNPIDTLRYKSGQSYKNFINAEPRATISYTINERSSIKTSVARNVQNVHLITNSISPFTSLEVWLPSSINIQPQIAHQLTLGYYRSLSRPGLSFMAEGYIKKMFNQIDYIAHPRTLLNPLLERELRFGEGTAYGIETQIKKDEGRLRGWLGYTYSRALRQFNDINGGRTYNAFYDRPHQINLMMSYDINRRWNVGMNWNYSTGAPFSSPTGFYSYQGQSVPIYAEKNNDRLPDYHRMDVSATLKLNKNLEKKFNHSLTFSIYNLYGRKNTLFIDYNKQQVIDGSIKIPANALDNDRVISQSYLFQFVPSFSYNFKFL
ncbi:TonB-dependent receptor [soil metagenome]